MSGWENGKYSNPGGGSGQLQYNLSGSFAGSSGITTDGNSLTIGQDLAVGSDTFVVDSATKKIGVGILSPEYDIHVKSVSSPGIRLEEDGISIFQISTHGSGGIISTQTNHPIDFAINGLTPIMRIDINGRLGIGTLIPTKDLDVNGSARIVSDATFDSIITVGGIATFNAALNINASLDIEDSLFIGLDGANVVLHVDEPAEKVGINVLNPAYGLDLDGTMRVTSEAKLEDKLGVGGVAIVNAQLDILQNSTTAAISVVRFEQKDTSESFISFIGTSGAGSVTSITTGTLGAASGAYKVLVNGVQKWVQYHDDP